MLPLQMSSESFYGSFEEGIQISDDVIESIKTHMIALIKRGTIDNSSSAIQWYPSRNWHFIFSLTKAPSLIFRAGRNNEATEQHYSNMLLARTVCRTNELGLLVIPNAKKLAIDFEGKRYELIAEKRQDGIFDSEVQEELFGSQAVSLNEAIRQLAVFICITGYSDVDWNKMCLVKNPQEKNSNCRIALVNLGEMGTAIEGLFGSVDSRGLLKCVMPSQHQIVIDVAKKYMSFSDELVSRIEDIIVTRRMETCFNGALAQFHQVNNVVKGDEPVCADLQTLGFTGSLLSTALQLVTEINEKIASRSSHKSLVHRRRVELYIKPELQRSKEQSRNELSIIHVVNILVQKKKLFNVIHESSSHLTLQA